MRFEKWQALGNDYLIVEARRRCPFALTAGARARALCDAHTGVGADGVLLLSEPDEPGFVAGCGSSTRTARRPSCRATARARRSCTCAAAGWTDADTFSIQTAAGEIRPTITGPSAPARSTWAARALRSKRLPVAAPTTAPARSSAGGREWRFQHVSIGNPQCAIHVDDGAELDALDLAAIGPPIEHHELFPNRTNVLLVRASSSRARSARASSSAAWGRRCPPAPARAAPRSRYVLRGGDVAGDACASTAASSRSRWGRTCTST